MGKWLKVSTSSMISLTAKFYEFLSTGEGAQTRVGWFRTFFMVLCLKNGAIELELIGYN